MKKLLAFALAVIMLCSLCVGCVDDDSPEAQLERQREITRELEEQYKKAQQEADDFKAAVDRYNAAKDALG